MAADERIERVGEALKGVFADPTWLKKSAIGAAINMIPYVGMVWVMGYSLHYQRALAWGREDRLPEWRDFQPQARTGLYAMVVGMVYAMPLSLVMGVAMTLVIMAQTVTGNAEAMEQPGFWIAYGAVLTITTVLSFLVGTMLWPVYVHVNMYDRIDVGFRLREICGFVRADRPVFWTAYRRALVIALLSLVVGFGAMGVVLGGGMGLILTLPRDVMPLAVIVGYFPLYVISLLLMSLVSLPFGFAGQRIWAGYARVVYGLASAPHDETLSPTMHA